MKKLSLFLLLAFLTASAAQGQEPKLGKAPGPRLGKTAPLFELPDQDGKKQKLETMLEKGKVALVFYRSASW